MTVSAWVGWSAIFISFLCILLNFLNCYNDFPDQTRNKTKTQNQKSGSKAIYLFQQTNGNVGVQGPLVGFIQHDGTRIRGTISVGIKPATTQAHPDIKGTAGDSTPPNHLAAKSSTKYLLFDKAVTLKLIKTGTSAFLGKENAVIYCYF